MEKKEFRFILTLFQLDDSIAVKLNPKDFNPLLLQIFT